jgi:hypothetical protein
VRESVAQARVVDGQEAVFLLVTAETAPVTLAARDSP